MSGGASGDETGEEGEEGVQGEIWRVMWIEGDEQDPVLTRYVLLAATLRIVASAPRSPRDPRHHRSNPASATDPKPPKTQSVNYNHLLPTRYALELESLKGVVAPETFKEVSSREDAKKQVKKAFEERYLAGKNRWFFSPLRF